MHATETLAEAERLMTVCNSCRYCEGLCAVFPAMEERRVFNDGDLNYLANLCHGCGACHIDCQFAPPHEFSVNVPATLARARAESYAAYAWPPVMAGLFARNGLAVSLISAASVASFIAGFMAVGDPAALYSISVETGAFYARMPHTVMATLFGLAFLYALFALAMGMRAFWRDIGEPAATLAEPKSLWRAMREAGRLRYLDGAGVGCHVGEDRPPDRRRLFHHLTFYGFILCFAATSLATLYHYAGREAPYPLYDLPVVLGALGGLGMTIGPAGLWRARETADPALKDAHSTGMDRAFIAMLFCVGASGLAVLALRATGALNLTLAAHLGFVFALFISMPYGKMVHGLYRFLALVRYAKEMRVAAERPPGGEG
jgi:citrate/tricarballylate utilization protein